MPDDGALGAYVNAMITDNFYVIAGLADANTDSTDPFEGFNICTTIELGTSQETRTSRDCILQRPLDLFHQNF